MKSDELKQKNEDLPIATYKKIMSNIEFMQNYVEEEDIFKPGSSGLKNFLIQSFTFLNPDFHYLSFVSKEDVDMQIIKVSQILQILPSSIKKDAKLFEEMSKDDVNKFWLKFFSLFTKQNEFELSSKFNISWENKVTFFKDIKSTFNYINYEIPILGGKKLNSVNITREIDSWKQTVGTTVNSHQEATELDTDEEETIDVDIKKLIIDLKHIVSMYNNTKKSHNVQSNPEEIEFFNNFISCTENILQYKNNLSVISFPLLDELNLKMLSSDKDLSGNLYYIKRCNNFMRTLKSKIKSLI